MGGESHLALQRLHPLCLGPLLELLHGGLEVCLGVKPPLDLFHVSLAGQNFPVEEEKDEEGGQVSK